MKSSLLTVILLAGAIIVAACSNTQMESAGSESTPTAMQEEASQPQLAQDSAVPEEDEATADASDDAAMSETDDAGKEEMAAAESAETEPVEAEMAELAPWQRLPLVDARSGETFTLADFAGKTVFVEPMATWCGNCKRQLGNVKDASAQIDGDDVVFVALSVETTIAAETLASYADDAGFDWTFAVMTPEMLQALSSAFGQTVSNPPATPHFIIRPDGSTTDLVTGIEAASDLITQIEAIRG